MRNFLIDSAKVVGTATEKSWSQTHLFFPQDPQKQELRGDLLAVLSLSGLESQIEAASVGRETISRLQEEYYGNLEGKALERLEKAVKKVCLEFSHPQGVEVGPKLEIGAAVVLDEALYLVISGGGKTLLQRDNQLGIVLQGTETVASGSGFLKEGDLFLLGTASFFKNMAAGVLKAALATGSAEEAAEALAPALHGRLPNGDAAAVIGKVQGALSEESVPRVKPAPPSLTPGAKVKKSRRLRLGCLKRFFSYFQGLLGKRTIYLKLPSFGTQEWEKLKKRKRPERSPKTIFTIILVLVVLLGTSVALGSRQRKQAGLEEKTASLIAEARQKMEEGEALVDLNPAQARELLLAAEALGKQIEAEGAKTEAYEAFKKELEAVLNRVLKEHETQVKTFHDLEIIKQEAKGDDWAVSGNKLMILDKGKSSVYEVGVPDKKASILAGGKSLETSQQIAAFLPQVFVLTKGEVVQINRLTKKETLVVEDEWGEITDIASFSGNLYLLDPQNGIWQYPAAENGLGSRREWLKEAYDLSGAVSMAIDGSIWVLEANGKIWKFNRGKKDAFGVAGLDQPMDRAALIYTDDDQENLYILDQGNSRVVVLAKSGEYQASYLFGSLGQISGLAALEEESKIWLLGGSKIYEIEIK